MEVGDRDLFNPNAMRDDMHDWVVANENMARVLAAKGYHYQFVFARNAGHVDRATKCKPSPKPSNTSGRATPSNELIKEICAAGQNQPPSKTREPPRVEVGRDPSSACGPSRCLFS